MSSSSLLEKTFPVGLFGVLIMIAFVLLLKADVSASGSYDQSGGVKRTYRGVAPERMVSGP